MNRTPVIFLLLAVMTSFFLSCEGDGNEQVEVVFDPDSSYTMLKTNVHELISDSGITRCKMITQTWLVFDRAKEPYWFFPDGVYVEKYDTLFNIETTIKADTAYYYARRNLCQLDGHVDISNPEGERFQTSQMFWDVNTGSFYSDAYIRITKGEHINEGIGFRANQDLSVREIYHSSAAIPFEMKRKALGDDVLQKDSIETQ